MTIVDSMIEHAQLRPDAIAFRYIADLEQAPDELSYAQLLQEASGIARFLQGRAAPGSRVMLFFPPGMAYIKAFFGCLLAGMVAVPLYPPRRNVKSDRIVKVAQSCQSVLALTTESELATVQGAWDEQNTLALPLSLCAIDAIGPDAALPPGAAQTEPSAVAFLQYTSGSTGVPKGVVITHANIVANMHHLSLMSTGNKDDVFVNWLPLFHDLGLVTAVLWPVYLGAPSILMAPATFVRDPVIWLRTIGRYKGTMCGAPSFAFDLCNKKIAAADIAGLDLRSWRIAYNAAEPVRSSVIAEFTARFAACGFRPETFYPSYGMAEATVFISGGEATAMPIHLTVDKLRLAADKLELVDEDVPNATKIVACGAALAPHDIKIVDPATCQALADGMVGEIWFAGPSVSPGYWQLEELSAATFGQRLAGSADNGYRYLRTGDIGVVFGGELFITGRLKDLIILNGRNYYPHDIEFSAAEAHPAIRHGQVAAFSLDDGQQEYLAIVAEIEREHFRNVNAEEVSRAVRQRVFEDHEVNAARIVLLKPYKIPMTSSGKIQRRQTRQMLLDGELDIIAQATELAPPDYVAPRTPMEQLVAGVWCKVLDAKRIGVTDNFIEIGGNSLAAMEIAAAIGKQFGKLELDYAQLLEFPTIAQSAAWLELKLAHGQAPVADTGAARRTVTL